MIHGISPREVRYADKSDEVVIDGMVRGMKWAEDQKRQYPEAEG
jgi:hypothetical protein